MLFKFFSTVLLGVASVLAASRTSPPSGAIVVSKTPTSGQFSTIQSAINSLPNDGSSKTIFIFPGTYTEQVSVTRTGKTILMGSTTNTASYTSNSVTLTHSLSAAAAGNDDDSGTLRVHTDNFVVYNINIRNTFGQGSQALALSSYGNQIAYYGVAFFGFQDTVLANQGTQFFSQSYIEGAVDFIFGQHGRVFIHKSTIASVAAGTITAIGPTSSTDVDLYVINESNIIQSTSATSSLAGKVFLGRPWQPFCKVAFINCNLSNVINGAGWEIWSTATPNTQGVIMAEFDSTGAGAAGTRASFATKLTSTSGYTMSTVLGSNFTSWVDSAYL